jgi:nucleoside-diphosphate-sugar epimerase
MRFDTVVNLFIAQSLQDGVITVHGGKQYRPLIHVRDVAETIIKIIDKPIFGLFNIGGENYTMEDLSNMMKTKLGCNVIFQNVKELRNYAVTSEKFFKTSGLKPARDIPFAIEEIKEAFTKGLIKDFKQPRYSNEELLKMILSFK